MPDDRNPKITPVHLDRKALVYVRQSSERQVQEHQESRRLQYGLRERAAGLGWREVEVVDEDLGMSASTASAREGFERMIAMVAMAKIGAIFSVEASRLSRTDHDWCRLLELCGVFNTLIGDAENIYDLKIPDDQLLLGIKGTLSVMELNVLKVRMQRGREEKARRGELRRALPAGLVYDGTGGIVLDPNRRVGEAIGLVFEKYRTLPSARALYLWLHEEGIELPVKKSGDGKGIIEWRMPTLSYVRDLLRNPIYAGAYAYGRRRTEVRWDEGRLMKRQGRFLPPEEWKVLIQGHHEGYISWEEHEENVTKMRKNALQMGAETSMGAAREGQGLLNGLLRCGRCGRKLHVRYWGKSGTAARYLCKGDFETGGRYCLGFGGATVDKRFGKELVKVVEPLTLEASMKAIEVTERKRDEAREILDRRLEEAKYETGRAFEQYNAVDARNRLVAAELECRWNEKMERVSDIEGRIAGVDAERVRLSDTERAEIASLAGRFTRAWESPDCRPSLKKEMIRSIVQEIVVTQEVETLHFLIHWKGGVHTAFSMPKPQSAAGRKTAKEDLDLIRDLSQRHGDAEIARVLNKLGRRTAKGKRWRSDRVETIRKRNDIAGPDPSTRTDEMMSIHQAARHRGVSETTIRNLAKHGVLKYDQIAPYAPWTIMKSDLDSEPVQSVCDHLLQTGKLVLSGVVLTDQTTLFPMKSAK